MLYKRFILIYLSLAAMLVLVGCGKHSEEYCYKINTLIKNEDFDTAKIENNKILLFDQNGKEKKELAFNDYDSNIQILSVRKDGAIIYFIMSGSVDDEQGIIFINDDSNKMFDGIKTLKRIGGNSYYYSTNQ